VVDATIVSLLPPMEVAMRHALPGVLALLAILSPALPLVPPDVQAWRSALPLAAVAPGPVALPPPAVPTANAPAVLLRFRVPASPVARGDLVDVGLLLERVDPLFGVDLTVTHDPNILELLGVTPGPLFPEAARYRMDPSPEPGPGRVRYISTLLADASPTASTGIMATLRFRAVGWGDATLGWDSAATLLSDRRSASIHATPESAVVRVPAPTATPAPTGSGGGGGGDGGGGSEPRPTHTPRPTSTPVPPREPTPTRTPKPTALPDWDLPTPGVYPTVGGYQSPARGLGAAPAGALFPMPTPGTAVPVLLPWSLPAGVPPVSGDGVVAILGPEPGVGTISLPMGESVAELQVDDEGAAVVVRVQPLPAPPSVGLLAGVEGLRAFSLDLYGYDAADGSAHRLARDGWHDSTPIVLRWRLGAGELARTRDAEGRAHPGRLALYRVAAGAPEMVETAWDPDPAPNGTLTALFVDRSTFVLALLPPEMEGRTVPEDGRYFRETGFRVGIDPFWDYFQRRGGVGSFGYPVSRPFLLDGFPVQIFQRGVLQLMPDGGVAAMNLLDDGLMPHTRISGSSFPQPDRGMAASAPRPSDPGYAERAIAFVQANVPDVWEGVPVGFRRAFFSRVRMEDAFPEGGEPALLPLLNLEMWGLPTSAPTRDPTNAGFVYQRFQRGILHYDAATGATEGLLLGDYLKAVITGQRLPPDLEEEAADSRFLRQYDRSRPGHMARWWELPGSDLRGAFEMDVPRDGSVTAQGKCPP